MKRIYQERSYTGLIDSAGTADWNAGSPADARAVRVAMESGIDLRSHRARQIQQDDFNKFDLIVVMDGSNHRSVSMMAPEAMRCKVRRLLECSRDHNGDVPDPYHGDESLFQSTFNVIYEGCINLAAELDRM
jgi:protein-tyrosine phosphatase